MIKEAKEPFKVGRKNQEAKTYFLKKKSEF